MTLLNIGLGLKLRLLDLVLRLARLPSFLLTRFVYGWSDPTRILVALATPAQKRAADELVDREEPVPADSALNVLVVIPFRDKWELTERCLQSIVRQDLHGICLGLVLVDNGSVQPRTAEGLQRFAANLDWVKLHTIRDDNRYNYSALNNRAVREFPHFKPDILLFLNNDVEIKTAGAIREMAGFAAEIPGAGAVGCTLVYPSMDIQHLFLAPGVKIVAAHPGRGLPLRDDYSWMAKPRPVAAVTAAAMALSATNFVAVGGFDEKLASACQDLDLCLKLQDAGLVNWSLPKVLMIHDECATRSPAGNATETRYLYDKWQDKLHWNAYLSRRISRWSEMPLLAAVPREFPWHWYRSGMIGGRHG